MAESRLAMAFSQNVAHPQRELQIEGQLEKEFRLLSECVPPPNYEGDYSGFVREKPRRAFATVLFPADPLSSITGTFML